MKLTVILMFVWFCFSIIVGFAMASCGPSGRLGKRATFESWAKGHALVLDRRGGVYTNPLTALAWEAFVLGVNTPRTIKI